jgi:hypothetical protein
MRVWYSASSTAHVWGTAYVEGTLQDFLAAAAAPWDDAQGDMSNATSPVRSGLTSLEQDGGTTYPELSKDMSGKFACTAWLYDDLDAVGDHAALLRVWDSAASHAIGVGFYTGQSTTRYAYHSENWAYTNTSMTRTAGWHQLSIAVAPATCHMLIDGTNVADLAVLNENAITRFSIDGDVDGASWFDDIYARSYVEPEPGVTVGAATAGVDEALPGPETGLRLGPAHPNPTSAGTSIPFALARAQHVTVSLVSVKGEAVRTLVDGPLAAGSHALVWDGRDARGRSAASGVYFVLARTGGETRCRRVVLLH